MNRRGVIDPVMAGFLLVLTLGFITTWIVAVSQPDTVNLQNPAGQTLPHFPAK